MRGSLVPNPLPPVPPPLYDPAPRKKNDLRKGEKRWKKREKGGFSEARCGGGETGVEEKVMGGFGGKRLVQGADLGVRSLVSW